MKKSPSKRRRIICLISCLPAILLNAIGFITLIRGKIFNITWLLAYAFLPLFLAWPFSRLARSDMKLWGKALVYPVILLAGMFLLTTIAFFGQFEWLRQYHGEALHREYAKNAAVNQPMPSLDELDSVQSMEYRAYSAQHLFFSWRSDTLLCQYNRSAYAEEKALLDQRYHFQKDKLGSCEPSIEADGYRFRLLDIEEYDDSLWYPKRLMLIGTNDQRQEIVYLFYNDPDLDYVGSTEDLLRNFCGWNHMQ